MEQTKEVLDDLSSSLRRNGDRLSKEIQWLEDFINVRLQNRTSTIEELAQSCPYPVDNEETFYEDFVNSYQLSIEERLLLILALVQVYFPEKLDAFLKREGAHLMQYSGVGGEVDKKLAYFNPTVKTFMFLIAGENLEEYTEQLYNLVEQNILIEKQIVYFNESVPGEERLLTSKIKIASEYFNHIVFGKPPLLEFSTDFPVNLLTTDQEWDELIVEPHVLDQLEDFVDWHQQKDIIHKNDESVKQGYLALFYGPPGTGKTMAASLLGKRCNLPVYRIDVSMIISKWVGETGKNIKRLFSKVKQRECILFFDEADSLFGARTGVDDAQDKYSNQEIATLLMEIEEYKGMSILATNLERNIDKAFRRRLQSQIFFDRPAAALRRRLWEQYMPQGFTLHEHIDLDKVARRMDVTGANIRNIYKMCAAKAAKRQDFTINGNKELVHYARLEMWKEGRLL
jgi:AAA+ superfamily predicted ATPase